MEIDTLHFKQKLEEETKILEGELNRIGRRNPSNPRDWEPRPPEAGTLEADKNVAADHVEAFEENSAVLKELEARYNNVKLALKKIEEGVYGKCEIGNEEIKIERLEANPAARTCTTHINNTVE